MGGWFNYTIMPSTVVDDYLIRMEAEGIHARYKRQQRSAEERLAARAGASH